MEEDFIESMDPSVDIAVLKTILPEWKTKVLYASTTPTGEEKVKMLIALKTKDDIKLWLEQFQEKNMTTYFIRSTEQCTGRYVLFKQRLFCHHNPRKSNVYKKRTKNTNCPSAITIKLRAVKKRYQGKNIENAPNSEMPCEVLLIPGHNHSIESPIALRYRRVSEKTKRKLMELYEKGHTPATALKTIKTWIHLNNNQVENLLSDRRFCPDYDYCYYIYKKEFKGNKTGLTDQKAKKEKNRSNIIKKAMEEVEMSLVVEQSEEDQTETCNTNSETIPTFEEELTEEEYPANIEIDQNGRIIENISVEIDNSNQTKLELDQILEQPSDDSNSITTTDESLDSFDEDADTTIYEYHLETGKGIIEKITTTMNEFLNDCPEKIAPALQLFYNRLESVENRTELISALTNFSPGRRRMIRPVYRNRRNSAIDEKKRLLVNLESDIRESKVVKLIDSRNLSKSVNSLSNEFLVL